MAKKQKNKQQEESKEMILAENLTDIFDGYTQEEIEELQGTTGLEETEEDRRPPYYVFNQDMVDDQGNDISPNNFYNCQTGEQKETIRCALLGVKETRDYSYYDEATSAKIKVCRSFDMQVGQWMKGEEVELRECAKCPYRLGKPGTKKACTIVRKFASYDLDSNEVFIFDAKRSSFVPMSNFLERNFYGKIKKGSKRLDIPLYMLETTLALKSEPGKGKRYYVLNPKITGQIKQKEKVLHFKSLADQVKKYGKDEYEDIQSKPPTEENNYVQNIDDDEDIPF